MKMSANNVSIYANNATSVVTVTPTATTITNESITPVDRSASYIFSISANNWYTVGTNISLSGYGKINLTVYYNQDGSWLPSYTSSIGFTWAYSGNATNTSMAATHVSYGSAVQPVTITTYITTMPFTIPSWGGTLLLEINTNTRTIRLFSNGSLTRMKFRIVHYLVLEF